jgi:hypothetical protein
MSIGNHNNKVWIDRGALRYMHNEYGVTTMIDIGCGPKNQSKTAEAVGYTEALTIDGDASVEPDMVADFNKNRLKLDKDYDLAWCIEVLPYIEEKKIINIKPALTRCKYVIATATTWSNKEYPNGNKRQWYIDKFESWGLEYDDEAYKQVVEHSLMDRKNHDSGNYTWLERTGMFFKNPKLIADEDIEDGGTF